MNTVPNNICTYGFYPGDKLTLEDIEEAIAKLPVETDEMIVKMEVCKKHYVKLTKACGKSNWNGIGGIPIFIVPYLKKAKMYQKNGVIKLISLSRSK